MSKKKFLITPSAATHQRLDRFLSEKIKELSRAQIQRLVDKGKVQVNSQASKSSQRLRVGDMIEVEFKIPGRQKIQAEDIPLAIIFEDEHVLIIDKASGIVVHPGAGVRQGTLANALLFHYPELKDIGPEERPGIVHRLDKETSGLMVIAQTPRAYVHLQRQFKNKMVDKHYLGLILGKMSPKQGKITWPIGRHPKHGARVSVKTRKPRPAETRYTVQQEFERFTLLDIQPITGRTHQIRVHLAAAGHPIAGDRRYGRQAVKIDCPRLFLHAHLLSFLHPETDKRVEFSSPLPKDLKIFLNKIEEEAQGSCR